MGTWNEAILSTFRRESVERLERVDGLLVDLEKNPKDTDVFTDVTREIHTLKGSAKMLGVDPMAELAHKVEDVLAAFAADRIATDADAFSVILEAMDSIRALAEAFSSGEPLDEDVGELCERLATIAKGELPRPSARPARSSAKPSAKPPRPQSTPVRPTPSAPPPADEPAEPAPEARSAPAVTEPKPAPKQPLKQPVEAGAAARQRLAVQPTVADSPIRKTREATRVSTATSALRRLDTVRTDIAKLDTIMNLVGEAAISHIKSEAYLRRVSTFERRCEGAQRIAQSLREVALAARGDQLGSQAERLAQLSGQLTGELKELRTELRDFRVRFDTDSLENKLLLDALQQEVAEIRMLPVATIFARFPRAARDMSREQGKLVDVQIEGENTRLDQKVLENIEAPLIHILRNAMDHGIENPVERARLGKPERGSLRLSAFREGGRIAITVEDDGRGLDPKLLKEAAINRGILTNAEAEALSDREAPYLVCVKGFSTARQVTDVSGRGVGMDVVKKMVEESKGELTIDSIVGRGTTIKISLPLTLAVTQVLMVEVGGQQYCIPTLSIEMVRMVTSDEVQLVADRPVVRVGRRSIPLVKLADVLRVDGTERELPAGKIPAVFLAHARQRIAFAVDRLVAEQQIVIKSFGRILRNVPNVAGATIFGSGEVGIILHTPDLVKHGLGLAGRTVPMALAGAQSETATRQLPILVVDDAMATREMERDILESAGWEVDTAINGRDALEKSRITEFGMFIVDLEMPIMNGWEFVAALRRSGQYAKTPIVILSSLGSETDKRRGLEVGADAYLVKSDFSQDLLLEVVARFAHVSEASADGPEER